MPKPPKPPLLPFQGPESIRPGISMKQERLIGRVCVAWAGLEATLQDILWQMLGVPIDDGRIFTSAADAKRKLQWLNAFAGKHLKGDEWTRLKTALDAIEQARGDRNFVVHGQWATHISTGDPIAMSVKEKAPDPTEVIAETWPDGRMLELVDVINAAKSELMRWANSHALARGKSPPYTRPGSKPGTL